MGGFGLGAGVFERGQLDLRGFLISVHFNSNATDLNNIKAALEATKKGGRGTVWTGKGSVEGDRDLGRRMGVIEGS